MTAVFAYRRRKHISLSSRIAWVIAAAFAGLAILPAHGAEPIRVSVDQAIITKLAERGATIVLGNPLIADVSLQAGGLLVVTGKGFGTTNLIALDRAGAVLVEHNIEVLGPLDKTVVVYRGVDRETYSCLPDCERRITLGDSPEFFGPTIGQSADRATRAQTQSGTAQH